jgi:asparagine synthase (glutamine-hydrolysing)
MCGIFAAINSTVPVEPYFQSIQHRGPEFSQLVTPENNNDIKLGFHRLGIINPGISSANQPFIVDGIYLICNGEIYNYQQLESEFSSWESEKMSDCRVILDAYMSVGIYDTVKRLDGEFALIIYDMKQDTMHVSRDPFGVRPLFYGHHQRDNEYFFASEYKAIPTHCDIRAPFPPNSILSINCTNMEFIWNYQYFKFNNIQPHPCDFQYTRINTMLTNAVIKRLMSDRSVGCLLSGGLDSSLIVSIASKCMKLEDLHTFSIGLKDGVDLYWSNMVVEYLGLKNHHSVEFTEKEALDIIPEVIKTIESYDITTVRASVPQFLLAKYIKENTNIKVLLSGEGSDELFAGYQYSKLCPSVKELKSDTIRLLEELYLYDNLRTDRTTAHFGLEVRVPFLDKILVSFVLQLDDMRTCNDQIEKKLLRDSFIDYYLPMEVLYRPKDAFSDAVSSRKVNWIQTIKNHVENLIEDRELRAARFKYKHNPPRTKEALYYRLIFEQIYPNSAEIIPHFWMPKWCDVSDPSATVLDCYTYLDL